MPTELGTYALPTSDIETVALRLGAALSVSFQERDSGYWGPYFLYGDTRAEHIKVYLNSDPMWRSGDPQNEQFLEPEFKDHGVLVASMLPTAALDSLRDMIFATFSGSIEIQCKPSSA